MPATIAVDGRDVKPGDMFSLPPGELYPGASRLHDLLSQSQREALGQIPPPPTHTGAQPSPPLAISSPYSAMLVFSRSLWSICQLTSECQVLGLSKLGRCLCRLRTPPPLFHSYWREASGLREDVAGRSMI